MKKESWNIAAESKFQKPTAPPRSLTPSGRPNRISAFSLTTTDKKNTKAALLSSIPKISTNNQLGSTKITTTTDSDPHIVEKSKTVKPMNQKESQLNFLASNLSKSMQGNGTDPCSKTKPKSRGVSPQLVRPRAVPERTPSASRGRHSANPNLSVLDRAPSASRARHSANPNPAIADGAPSASRARHSVSQSQGQGPCQTIPIREEKQAESATMMKGRRQASSPSVNRGRKVGPKQDLHNVALVSNDDQHQQQKGGQVLGSRMVDKFLNARKTCAEERQLTKPNKGGLYGSINESSGFGRMISNSSLDMAVKHMVRMLLFFMFFHLIQILHKVTIFVGV